MDDAQRAVRSLIDSGFHREEISLVARNEHGETVRQNAVGETSTAAESAGTGAVGGTVVGGVIGLLVGAGLLAIPGIGPVLAAGPLAAAIGTTAATAGAGALGAGVGAATGGLMGGLIGVGVPENEARFYSEGVQHGDVLVSVSVDSSSAASARELMRQNGAAELDSGGMSATGAGNPTTGTGIYDTPTGTGRDISTTGGGTANTGTGIYESPESAGPDYARGQRDMPPAHTDSDYAHGMHETERSSSHSYSDYESDFRNHYRSSGSAQRPYDDYAPAYRYGYNLADITPVQESRWEDVEMNARQDWERENPSTWDEFKATVRYAWERARGQR
jgi:hypothetical protein